MAAHRRPSFLKREKERKRLNRALDKRQAKQERRRARAEAASPEVISAEETVDSLEGSAGSAETETEIESDTEEGEEA